MAMAEIPNNRIGGWFGPGPIKNGGGGCLPNFLLVLTVAALAVTARVLFHL
jgi:hypothetical protein